MARSTGEGNPRFVVGLLFYFSRSGDQGRAYAKLAYYDPLATFTEDDPDVDRVGYVWGWLTNRQDVAEGDAQLRMTPDGKMFYTVYLSNPGGSVSESDQFFGSDIWFRKVEVEKK